MPLQINNFSGIRHDPVDYSGVSNALGNYLTGAYAPQRAAEEQRKMELANALSQIQNRYEEPKLQGQIRHQDLVNQYYGPSQEANIAHQRLINKYYPELTEAQIQHYKDQASGRTYAPSPLGKLVQERNDLASMNPNDPLIAEYDRVIKAQGGAKFAPSGLGKLYNELQQVEEGYLPGSNGAVPLTPEEQNQFRNRYNLQIQKTTTDSKNREQVIQGQNLVKSQDASNLDALTQYAGPYGQAKLLAAKAASLSGKPSKDYLDYVEAQAAAHLEVDEYRQFLGTSITPEARKALEDLINPNTLLLGKEEAQRKIQKARDTIKKQIQTRVDALQTPEAYITGSATNNAGLPPAPQEFSAVIQEQQGVTPENPLGLTKRKKE